MSLTTRTSTCNAWCADPVYADQRTDAVSCKAESIACEIPRFLVGYLNTDESTLCRHRCVKRERPVDWDGGSLTQYVSDEVGDTIAAAKAIGRDVIMTMAEWSDMRGRYEQAKARVREAAEVSARYPQAASLKAKVADLQKRQAWIDGYIAPAAMAGYGFGAFGIGPAAAAAAVPAAAAVSKSAVIIAGSVVLGVAAVAAIYYYVSGAAELHACLEASKSQPTDKQAEFLDQCRRSGWPPWTKAAIGLAAVAAVAWVAKGQLERRARA